MWKEYNPSPTGRNVGDCSVRAVAKALGIDWETAYMMNVMNGFAMGDMPSSDAVWGATLRKKGFKRTAIPNTCPSCYTAADFCRDNTDGTFVLGFGDHCACVVDGDLYDSWNSEHLVPIYVWYLDDEPEFGEDDE